MLLGILETLQNWFEAIWTKFAKCIKEIRKQKKKKEKERKKEKNIKGPRGQISAQQRNKSAAHFKNPKRYPVFFLSSLTRGPK
jgi:SNF2 family DNA or RNA helicase